MLIIDHLDKTKGFVQQCSLTEMKYSKFYVEKFHQFHTDISREWKKKKNTFSSLNKVNIYQIPKSEEDITINERKIKTILIENDEMALFVHR